MLKDRLDAILNKYEDPCAIYIKEFDGDILYEHNKDIRVISASIIKVGILLCAMDEVDKGHLRLDEIIHLDEILDDTVVFDDGKRDHTLEYLLNFMIINSDNTATNQIIKLLGFAKINAYFTDVLECKDTRLERYMLDEKAIKLGFNNYSSHNDMYKIFYKLYKKEILNDGLCDLVIKILKRQRSKDQLLRYLYKDYDFAHKTGELDYLNHDVGVLSDHGHDLYIGVFVYDTKDIRGNFRLIGEIGKVIFEELGG